VGAGGRGGAPARPARRDREHGRGRPQRKRDPTPPHDGDGTPQVAGSG
jgi:hypothetical protein